MTTMNTPQQSNRRQQQQQHGGDSQLPSSASKYGPSYGTSPIPRMQTVSLESSGVERRSLNTGFVSPPGQTMNASAANHSYVGTPGLEYGEYTSTTTIPSGKNRYGEIRTHRNPFHNVRRRRKGDSLAKWTTRAVLASPLLILVLWSTAVIFHHAPASTQQQQQNQQQLQTTTMKRTAATARGSLGKTSNHHNGNKGGRFVAAKPKPKPKPKPIRPKPKPKPKPKHKAAAANANTNNNVMIVQPTQQKTLDTSSGPIPIIVPLGESQTVDQVSTTLAEQTSNELGTTEETSQGQMGTTEEAANELGTAEEAAGNQMTTSEETANELGTAEEAAEGQLTTAEETGNELGTAAESEASAMQLQQVKQQQQTTKVYYYDASASVKDGNLHIPDVVYDNNGQPVKLTDLNNGRAEIYLEPPSLTQTAESDTPVAASSSARQAEVPSLGATQQQQENEQQPSNHVGIPNDAIIATKSSSESRNSGISDSSNQSKCACVNCHEDRICGGLWNGMSYEGMPEDDEIYSKEIHMIISHCQADLYFMADFIKDFTNIASIHIISKCGKPVVGAPQGATIQTLKNVGRCDNAYAYYITSVLDEKLKNVSRDGNEEDAVVVFLKDNMNPKNLHQAGHWNTMPDMIRVASSNNGFACGVVTTYSRRLQNYALSVYFDVEELSKFTLHRTYTNPKAKYETDGVEFKSVYQNWGEFYDSLPVGPIPTDVVQVCNGGVFAASVKNIRMREMAVWKSAEEKLSRGDNILEGHYMERMWALFLATPLQQYQVDALRSYSNYLMTHNGLLEPYTGALVHRVPPFYSQESSGSSSSSDE